MSDGPEFSVHDGELQNLNPYVSAWVGDDEVNLDGHFNALQLEFIAKFLRDNSPENLEMWKVEIEGGQYVIANGKSLKESIATHGLRNVISITRFKESE